jgi:hypothetical protein
MYQKESPLNGMDGNIDHMILNEMAANEEYVITTGLAFTPTTLANFANTLTDLNNDLAATQSSTSSGRKSVPSADQYFSNSYQSDSSDYDDDDDDESQDSNSNTVGKRVKMEPEYVNINGTSVLVKNTTDQRPPRKLPGPRPSRTLEEMTPIEAERRKRRRERNKNAAAKCRQRRVDLTNELLTETEQLEQESTRLEREIANLRRQKNQLEFVLEAHKPSCHALPSLHMAPHNIKSEKVYTSLAAPTAVPTTTSVRPNSLPIANPTTCYGMTITTTSSINGNLFSFDPNTSLTGLTPMLSAAADLSSPSSYLLLSPSTLLAQ